MDSGLSNKINLIQLKHRSMIEMRIQRMQKDGLTGVCVC